MEKAEAAIKATIQQSNYSELGRKPLVINVW
jgi:hypothetical protein